MAAIYICNMFIYSHEFQPILRHTEPNETTGEKTNSGQRHWYNSLSLVFCGLKWNLTFCIFFAKFLALDMPFFVNIRKLWGQADNKTPRFDLYIDILNIAMIYYCRIYIWRNMSYCIKIDFRQLWLWLLIFS